MNILVFCVENKILPVADNKLWWCSYSAEAQQSVREKWKPDFLGKKRTSKPLTEEMAFSAPKSLMFLQTPQSWRFCAIHFHDTACGFLMELNIQWQPPVCKNQCHFVASLFYFQVHNIELCLFNYYAQDLFIFFLYLFLHQWNTCTIKIVIHYCWLSFHEWILNIICSLLVVVSFLQNLCLLEDILSVDFFDKTFHIMQENHL